MIQSLLIANRGEIACRVIRTARAMGVRTVAVYSDADRHALHVRQADEAVHIGPSPAAESYLRGDRIIEAAKASGAEAIHPGYGFLSENADFAQAVLDAGLVWVGPSPASIRAMGLKDAAKKLMQEAGVPVTPGYLGEDQLPERLRKEADSIGYPILIKAVAGGGGKGMRKVDAPEDFLAALESCKREAKSSFANDEVLLEKWITSPRHIEVQVFGDSHGDVVHLFERDCSLQRRHQKVIEEAPAPGMDEATRAAICAAAVRAAKAVDYVGAGTIEFIADASEGLRADRVFFMEMNTRLQVEHPVTEEITGVDLVEWQLRVASGEPLPLKQEQLSIDGHAIEARLYAEDPAKGFLPSIGRLDRFQIPQFVRVETGISEGDTVTPFYDPMIAKVISRAECRDEAIDQLIAACRGAQIWPVKTNAAFLAKALSLEPFKSGAIDTSFIEQNVEVLTGESGASPYDAAAGALLFLSDSNEPVSWQPFHSAAGMRTWIADSSAKWNPLFGFRLNSEPEHKVRLSVDGTAMTINLDEVGLVEPRLPYDYDGSDVWIEGDWTAHKISNVESTFATSVSAHDGDILAPMPGKVIAVDVSEGQQVEAGQRLMVLEAMKMEHALTAPFAGTVAELAAHEGQQVQVEALLARVVKAES